MVRINKPITLVKLGKSNENLEEAVKKFSEKLVYFPIGLGNTNKYALFNEKDNYLLIVSQQKDKIVSPLGHNVILTITSYSDETNQETADRFEKETKIDLNVSVPRVYKKFYQYFNNIFPIFEKNPQVAMIFLTGLR